MRFDTLKKTFPIKIDLTFSNDLIKIRRMESTFHAADFPPPIAAALTAQNVSDFKICALSAPLQTLVTKHILATRSYALAAMREAMQDRIHEALHNQTVRALSNELTLFQLADENLLELIKNSFDSFSTTVSLTIDTQVKGGEEELVFVFEDNGSEPLKHPGVFDWKKALEWPSEKLGDKSNGGGQGLGATTLGYLLEQAGGRLEMHNIESHGAHAGVRILMRHPLRASFDISVRGFADETDIPTKMYVTLLSDYFKSRPITPEQSPPASYLNSYHVQKIWSVVGPARRRAIEAACKILSKRAMENAGILPESFSASSAMPTQENSSTPLVPPGPSLFMPPPKLRRKSTSQTPSESSTPTPAPVAMR
jgi:hypothetical protein